MPLARPAAAPAAGTAQGGAVIQRLAIGANPGEASSSPLDFSPAAGTALLTPPATASKAAAAPDIEEVVDRVMRRLTRTLAVESERHGGRQWP